MAKKKKNIYANYFDEFKCIGGNCTDSCCIGWDIGIDKATFKKYHKVENMEMKKMFQKNVHNNGEYISSEIDYGKVKLKKDKRCPFLDEHNYCIIYSKLGEDYLSNVCTAFPRIVNKINGYYELTLDVACPEAARIILLNKEGINFIEKENDIGKHIISTEVDTRLKEFNNSPIKYFKEIRRKSVEILQSRNLTISERVFVLGDFIDKLNDVIEEDLKNVPKFIKEYEIVLEECDFNENSTRFLIQLNFFKKMVGFLNVNKEVDSKIFIEHTKDIEKSFMYEKENFKEDERNMYINEFKKYDKQFIEKFSYIFENYLVNFVYNNNFPFSESDSIFDGYIMLLMRISFIRYYLVGLYIQQKQTSKEEIVEFIQVFSKVIEHHKSYLINALAEIKENEFDNMEFAKLLL